MPPNDFDQEKQRALAAIVGVQGHLVSAASYAAQTWLQPYNDWLKLCAKTLVEPPPPVQEWPARAIVASISYLTDAAAQQHAAYELVMAACKSGVGTPTDVLRIDPVTEAAGPIVISPLVPVLRRGDLVRPSLVCPTAGAIPVRCVAIALENGVLQFSLVDLARGGRGPQPLKVGLYTGALHLNTGALVATLKVQVVESIA